MLAKKYRQKFQNRGSRKKRNICCHKNACFLPAPLSHLRRHFLLRLPLPPLSQLRLRWPPLSHLLLLPLPRLLFDANEHPENAACASCENLCAHAGSAEILETRRSPFARNQRQSRRWQAHHHAIAHWRTHQQHNLHRCRCALANQFYVLPARPIIYRQPCPEKKKQPKTKTKTMPKTMPKAQAKKTMPTAKISYQPSYI